MSENQSTHGPDVPPVEAPPPGLRHAFPFARLFYAIGFAVVAWAVFWVIVLVLAPLQFVARAIAGQANEDLRQFSRSMTIYLQELLAYVTFVRDDRPFPIGPFPKG